MSLALWSCADLMNSSSRVVLSPFPNQCNLQSTPWTHACVIIAQNSLTLDSYAFKIHFVATCEPNNANSAQTADVKTWRWRRRVPLYDRVDAVVKLNDNIIIHTKRHYSHCYWNERVSNALVTDTPRRRRWWRRRRFNGNETRGASACIPDVTTSTRACRHAGLTQGATPEVVDDVVVVFLCGCCCHSYCATREQCRWFKEICSNELIGQVDAKRSSLTRLAYYSSAHDDAGHVEVQPRV